MSIRVAGLTVVSTIVCAVSIGMLMQNRAERDRLRALGPETAPAAVRVEAEQAPLQLNELTFTSLQQPAPAQTAIAAARPVVTVRDTGCPQEMRARAQAGALIEVSLSAPCRAGERVTLHHGGLMLSETLDMQGNFTGVVPAFSERAVVIADFASGRDMDAQTWVPDLDAVDRVVLQWQGAPGLELHALEFGASYGQAGHVWREALPGQGEGDMLALGDAGQVAAHLAQVYTLPHAAARRGAGPVDISVEAEITNANCNQGISLQLIERRDQRLRSRDLSLEMPDCAAVGDFLVLNNLVESLKVASSERG